MVGEHLDLTSGDDPAPRRHIAASHNESSARRFLGVHFACCDVYARIYINHDQTAYAGNCPRCHRQLSIGIGPGGSNARFFTAH
ncbi:MAG: hypothetical protein KDA42_07565 [Planctomycetales bacterium]|nr:hypothetical protein [Planctomycetales bacterium]